MNNETKDLLQMVKTTSKYLDARLTLDSGCCKCLLEYIDELNNKIDKAIKIMEDYTLFDLKADKVMKVIKILKESEVNE